MAGVVVESRLSYVDDVLIFCQASAKSFSKLNLVIEDFYRFSGLSVNLGNSHVAFSKSISNRSQLAGILDFPCMELPFVYLGTPITGKALTYDYLPLLSSLQDILLKWSGKKLSYCCWEPLCAMGVLW